MTDRLNAPTLDASALDPNVRPELYEGVLSRRFVAFLIDAVFVGLLTIPAAIILSIFGVLTLGLGFFLFPALIPAIWLAYVALTVGSPAAATPGMRITGLRLVTTSGRPPFALLALLHSLLFWFFLGLPVLLLIGLVTDRHRQLHDMILDLVVVNTAYLPAYGR